MKPAPEVYNQILPLPPNGEHFIHFPGCYCRGCGEVFALYSFSMIVCGVDEEGKPYINKCYNCNPPRKMQHAQDNVN